MVEKCLCGHSRSQHNEMNDKQWARFHKQLSGYEERNLKDRTRFWTKFLTEGSDEEWKCSKCQKCDSFKLDNLKLIEDLAKEKGLA